MADSINILVPKEAIDSIIQTDAAITKLDIVYRKMLDTIAQGNQVLKESATTQNTLNEASKNIKKTSEELDAASKKLKASEEALNNFDKEKYAATLRNTEALKVQQKEILQMVQAEKQLTGTIEKAEASTKALTAERKKLDLETAQGIKRLKEINTVIDKNTEIIRSNGDAATKQRMNIGNYKSALEGLPGPLGNIATSANTAGTALKAVSKIPLLAVILGIIGALTGLFAAFKSTEEGGDRVQKIFGKIKGVLDVLKIAAQSTALALADLLSGKFGQAAEHMKEGFGGIGQRMKEAAKAGGELAMALDDIADEKLAYNIDAIREKIAELRTAAAEATDPAERAAKLREAIALTEEMYGKQIDWSKRAATAEINNVTAKFKVSADELRNFLLADEAGRKEQIKGNSALGQVMNSLNNEGLRDLRDKLTEEDRLNKDFNMETLRMRKTISSAAQKDIADAQAAQKKAFDERVKQLQLEASEVEKMAEEDKQTRINKETEAQSVISENRDKELSALSARYRAGEISTEAYEKEKLAITRKYEDQILREQLKNIDTLIETSNLTTTQKAELLAKSAALQLQLDNKLTEDLIDNQKKIEDAAIKAMAEEDKAAEDAKKKKEARDEAIMEASIALAEEVGNAIFEIQNSKLEEELSLVERKRDAEIQAAGDSKEEQARINAKYDKEAAAIKLQQAKNDRNAALFNIAIGTAVNIVSSFKTDPTGILAALMAAIGIIQAGVVLAKPLPTFAKGTKGKYDTPSAFIAGEAGTEWLENKSGQLTEVNGPTIFKNAQGMRVYSNREIRQMDSLVSGGKGGFDSPELKEIRKGIDNMNRTLAGQKQYLIQNGKPVGYQQSGYTRKYIERMIG